MHHEKLNVPTEHVRCEPHMKVTTARKIAPTVTASSSELAASPLPSRGPTIGRNCWAELLRHPCILGGPQRQARGENQNGCLTPAFSGGWNGYVTPPGIAMSPLRSRGSPTPSVGRISELATSPLPSRGPTSGRNFLLRHPCILRGPQQRGENQKWLPQPCLLRGPKVGGIATSPVYSRGPQQRGENQK